MKYLADFIKLVLLLFCLPQIAHAQAQSAPLAINSVVQAYDATFTAHPQLYNGPEYIDYSRRYFKQTGHQYFLSSEKKQGNVFYNKHLFSNVELLYDTVLDQIIIKHPTSPLTLRLVNEHVNYFTIDNHSFVRLTADSTLGKYIQTGYYEVCADGAVTLLAKRIKQTQEEARESHINVEFIENDKFFIKKESKYSPISSKATLLRATADHTKELQKYIRDNKLKFRKMFINETLLQSVKYYNSLAASSPNSNSTN